MKVWSITLLVCLAVSSSHAAKILGLFPHLGHSHFIMFRSLLDALHERGHELVVVSHFPRKTPLANYTDVSLYDASLDLNNKVDFKWFDGALKYIPFAEIAQLYVLLEEYKETFSVQGFRELLGSDPKFDLVLTETFNTDAFLAVPYKLKVPFIGLSSGALMPWVSERMGSPENPAYCEDIYSSSGSRWGFVRRLSNAVHHWGAKVIYRLAMEPYSQRIAEAELGPLPPLSDIADNTSLLLINTHFSFLKPRPLPPNVVEVSGLHIKPPKPLPQDIQTLMDNAKDGVIYFSMGSLLRGTTLPENKRDAFIKAFAKLNQTVLWKWEDDELPGKSPNVHTFKWISQRDVLEHPNVVLYIAHGGLFGLSEAVHCGIPIVGIPIFGDQPYNIQNIVDMGAAVKLDYSTISEETVSNAIHTILNDSRYRENAKVLSARYRDRQNSALETAVYWTEYVIRHKGARHLRSAAAELTWYQYLLLDVLSFIALFLLFFLIMMYLLVKIVYSMIVSKWKRKSRKAKKH